MNSKKLTFEVRSKPAISQIRCVVLDYDGTLTTLRRGWDKILSTYAREAINPGSAEVVPELEKSILYLTEHAGGTTPKQLMSRLVSLIEEFQFIPQEKIGSIDFYAREFSVIFQAAIDKRIENFHAEGESYVINGVRPLLEFLSGNKILNYVVTGSSKPAVSLELEKLEMMHHFIDVYGASLETIGNLKEDAIKEIMERHSLKASEILVIGDGSTEIRAAETFGLPSVGIASDEHTGGMCQGKRESLIKLGADVIIADYTHFEDLWAWLHS
jgi:phosphoglycolate phosphatase-like HAD superfamily hydrolase